MLLYGSEVWSLREADIARLEAFEMWVWRITEKVKWANKKTNEEVLHLVNETRKIIPAIIRRKRWIGYS